MSFIHSFDDDCPLATTFVRTVHQNYVGTDSDKMPVFLSVVLTDSNNQGVPQYKAILWKKTVRFSTLYLVFSLSLLIGAPHR